MRHYVELTGFARQLGMAVQADCSCGWHSAVLESAAEVLDSDGSARESELRAVAGVKGQARAHAAVVVFEGGLPV